MTINQWRWGDPPEKWAETHGELAPPNLPQWRILSCPHVPLVWWRSGRGGGKTLLGVYMARQYAQACPGSIQVCTEPTYPMIADILQPEFERQFADSLQAERERAVYHQQTHTWELGNGSIIRLRQCDKYRRLRGPGFARLWMDEVSESPYDAFRIMLPSLRQLQRNGQPYPKRCLLTGNPAGMDWVYWTFTPGDRPDGVPQYIADVLDPKTDEPVFSPEDVRVFQSSSFSNKHLDPFAKALAVAAYPPGTAMYRQEVLGEVVAAEGLVYQEFDLNVHVVRGLKRSESGPLFLGIDWGVSNPTVVLVIQWVPSSDQILVLGERRYTQKPASETSRLTLEWLRDAGFWRPGQPRPECFRDPAGADETTEWRQQGWLMRAGMRTVKAGIQALHHLFAVRGDGKPGILIDASCSGLIGELTRYGYATGGKDGEPVKVDDHGPDALRYGGSGLWTRFLRHTNTYHACRSLEDIEDPNGAGRRQRSA